MHAVWAGGLLDAAREHRAPQPCFAGQGHTVGGSLRASLGPCGSHSPCLQRQPGGVCRALAERCRRQPGCCLFGKGPGLRGGRGAAAPHGPAGSAAGAVGQRGAGGRWAGAATVHACGPPYKHTHCRLFWPCMARCPLFSPPHQLPVFIATPRTSCMLSGWACEPGWHCWGRMPTAPCWRRRPPRAAPRRALCGRRRARTCSCC